MGFPDNIRIDALVACGRHCCLCHKFCGTKIEVHHIHFSGEKGDDSFENALPLCFDCHADMRSYDYNHPKGTKYSESELKRHRDRWYEKIRNNIGLANRDQIVETDKKVFELFINILPWNGSIQFIRENNFDGFAFGWNRLDDFSRFIHECNNPILEFVDPDLEGLRANLLQAIKEFMTKLSTQSWPLKNNSELQQVPPEWEIEQPDRFHSVVNYLHNKADEICKGYDTLVKTAVRKLGVIPTAQNDDIFA